MRREKGLRGRGEWEGVSIAQSPPLVARGWGLLKKARLPPICFHDLRHSAATILLGMGVPMKVVQELLGHSRFTITADVYAHVFPSMLEGAMEKWDDFFADSEDAN